MEYYKGTIGDNAQNATINANREIADLMSVYIDGLEDSNGADAIARLSARYKPYITEIISIAHIIMDYKRVSFAHAVRATVWKIKHTIAYGKTGNVADAIEHVTQWAFARCNSNFNVTRTGGRNSERVRTARFEQITDDTAIEVQDDFIYSAMLKETVRTLRRKMDAKTRERLTGIFDASRGAGTADGLFDAYTGELNAEKYDAKTRKFASRLAMAARVILGLDATPNASDLLRSCFLFWNE